MTECSRGKVRKDIKPERVKYIEEEVACWRKANQIHKWFVDNVQDGNDDCKQYYISHEQLQELVDICKKVLAASKLIPGVIGNGYTYEKVGDEMVQKPILESGQIIEDPSVAQTLLPTQAGFFFGSTDYNECYLDDLQSTIEQLEPVLQEGDCGSFYYQSSW